MTDTNIITLECVVIKKCIEGDHNFFKKLYDSYKDRVYSTSVRMLGNRLDAEDALQEIFIKVFKNISRFRGDSSFTTWLYKIAVNTCIEHIRKRKKDEKIVDIDPHDDNSPVLPGIRPAENFRLIVESEIEKLPEGYKTVFILHAIEGFKYREIADILDISQGTSKSQFFHAKSLLRKKLLPYLEVLKYEL
ncbi:MAG: RNA polymerase sigma factor [Candidatus Latescibacteria bacterium]|nr:RNA polymerase sigma factor [Candidatus Latescibacterota bacterium]